MGLDMVEGGVEFVIVVGGYCGFDDFEGLVEGGDFEYVEVGVE